MTQQPAIWPISTQLDPQATSNLRPHTLYTLGNGLRVLIISDTQDRSCKFEVLVNAGAVHQQPNKRGIPHFTEHMVFRSTADFADNEQIMQFAQNFNLDFNGFTSRDMQSFHAVSDADMETAEAAAKLISQIVFHPRLEEKYIKTEREIVYSEQQAGESDPQNVTQEELVRHFYPDTHALGAGGLIGEPETILDYTHDDVVNFYTQYFHPANMLLVVSGGLSEPEFKQLVEKYFDKAVANSSWVVNPLLGELRQTTSTERINKRDFNHVNVIISQYLPMSTAITYPSLEFFSLRMAEFVLSTRLFLEVREKLGLAYAVWAEVDNMHHGVAFNVQGEFPQKNYVQGKAELIKHLSEIITKPITNDEFKRALRNRKSVRWADRTSVVANFVGKQLFSRGQIVSPEVGQYWYEQLSVETVNAHIQQLLSGVVMEEILVGPVVKE
jgi:predicted Zn-dependent peptidase